MTSEREREPPNAVFPEIEDYLDDVPAQSVRVADARHSTRFLLRFFLPYKKQVLLVVALFLVDAVLDILFPLAAKWLIDEGLIGRDWDVVVTVLGYLALATIGGGILGIYCDYLEAGLLADVVRDMRTRLFDALQSRPWRSMDDLESGQVLSRFSGDVVATEVVLVSLSSWLILPVIEITYATVLMFHFDVWLGAIGALLLPLAIIGPRWFARKAFATSYEKRSHEGELLCAVHETIEGQAVIRAFGLKTRMRRRFLDLSGNWRGAAFRLNFFSALVESSADIALWFVHMLVLGLGAYWVFEDRLTIGTLVAFEAMFLSMGYALGYLMEFVPILAEATGSIRHLDEFLSEPTEEDAGDAAALVPSMQDSIALSGVCFSYGGARQALKDVSFSARKGTLTCVVGPSGSGKTTLLGVLLGLHRPEAGEILVDGRPLVAAELPSLRAQTGTVFQDNYLFDTSIEENIALGAQDATHDDVVMAARAAEIHDFIAALPNGYATRVGETGRKLSAGQRQRIAIARALVGRPAILLLDEVTSGLDYESEAHIIRTLKQLAGDRTIIHVTHRLSATEGADQIVVLRRGSVEASGSPNHVRRRSPFYAKYWRKGRATRQGKSGD